MSPNDTNGVQRVTRGAEFVVVITVESLLLRELFLLEYDLCDTPIYSRSLAQACTTLGVTLSNPFVSPCNVTSHINSFAISPHEPPSQRPPRSSTCLVLSIARLSCSTLVAPLCNPLFLVRDWSSRMGDNPASDGNFVLSSKLGSAEFGNSFHLCYHPLSM